MATFYYVLLKNVMQTLHSEKLEQTKSMTCDISNSSPVSNNQQIFTIIQSIFEIDINYTLPKGRVEPNAGVRRTVAFGDDASASACNEVEVSDSVSTQNVNIFTTNLLCDRQSPNNFDGSTKHLEAREEGYQDRRSHDKLGKDICNFSQISDIIRDYMNLPSYNIYSRMITAIYVCNYPRKTTAKFDYLSYLVTNIFYSEYDKEQFQILFGRAYQIYRGFSLLARLYRIKKLPPHNTCDLVLNPFVTNFNDLHSILKRSKQQPFMLIQNGAKYFFGRIDLIRLLNTSLGNTFDFFAKPLVCTNPYNKIAFEYHDLYNIYFYIKEGNMKISELIEGFYASNFVLEKFLLEKEYIIREYAIKEYILNHPDDEIYDDIIDMIDEYCPNITIHADFPRKKLVVIMKPYLYLYFVSIYSIIPSKKNKYRKLFKQKIQHFNMYNPTFGRKIINTTRSMFGEIVEGHSVNIRFIDHCAPLLLSDVM
jgi:hypothetical protein